MSGRTYAGTERALKAWKPGADLNQLAVRHGINPSTLYRALIRAGLLTRKAKPEAV